MHLQLKILLFFLLVGILPLAIMGGYSLIRVEDAVRSSTHRNLLSLGTEVGKEILQAVNEGYNAVHLLAKNPVLLSPGATRNALFEELGKTFRFYPIIQDLTLIGPDGHVRASVRHSFRGTWSSTAWFQRALGGESLLSEVHTLIYPYQAAMTVAVPVLDKGGTSVRDVLIGQIEMEHVWKIVRDVSFGAGGQTLLVDSRGLVVATSENTDSILRPVAFPSLADAIRNKNMGVMHVQGKQELVTAFLPVDVNTSGLVQTGWHIVLIQPVSEAYMAVFRLRQGLIWAGVFSLAVMIIFSVLLSRQISRRILTLVTATRDLGRGTFNVDLEDLGRDEIGELGRAFSQANRELAESDLEIKTYQKNLHALVEQQTQELRSANVSLQQEIEERKRIEETRERLEEQLRQSQKMEAVGTLAGGIAHDFNNMLQAISSHAQLLLLKSDPGPFRDALAKIDQTVTRATELARRLLTFSRKTESKRTRMSLNIEVENVAALLRRTLPKMIHIQTSLAPDLDDIVADPVQMEQALVNLASNAGDAMPDGGTLTIETQNVLLDETHLEEYLDLKPGPHVLLKVSDTGCGMDEKVKQRIFEPFFTTKDVDKGTGLGLAMVYGIVKDHRGHIHCVSQPDQGAAFTVLFPAVTAGDVFLAPKKDVRRPQGLAMRAETILVVEDEELIREVSQEVLENSGYTVLLAASGEEALEIYAREQERIDLVITDLGMPGMGGEALLARLLQLDPQAKMIVSSGYAVAMNSQHLQKAAGRIAKPYTFDNFLRLVREILDRE